MSEASTLDAPQAVGESLTLRPFERGTYEELYVTGAALPGAGAGAAGPAFAELAAAYLRRGIQPVQEKVYGLLSAREQILSQRRAAFRAAGLDPDLPCTYIQGRPLEGGEFAGLQAWGVRPREGQVENVEGAGELSARLWTGPGFRVLYLPMVRGLDAQGEPLPSPSAQAERMFAASQEALERHGFTFRDVRRTWIYFDHLLDWYGTFNRVRTRFFRAQGVGEQGLFPASTGIEGTSLGEECCMDVLAIQADPGAHVPMAPILHSERQGRAFSYGSAFSRAMRVGLGEQETIYVSGTASIDPSGKSRFLDEPDAQILETLLSVSALLQERGGSLEDICQATLFCKRPEYLQVYEQVTRLLGISKLPIVPVVADVCRADLLVELEAIAVVPGREAVK
jgi:enamine deaminase RidA (YjgF/YER057c/UK114 family)